MQRIGFPFDSHVTFDENGLPSYDRAITSAPLRSLIGKLFTDGIAPNPSDNLQVSASGAMTVVVNAGFAICGSCLKLEEEPRTLTVQASDPTNDRIDTVVLRLNTNDNARYCDLYVIEGIPALSPARPKLTRTATIWEIGLADIFIPKKSGAISDARITDTRYDSGRCGVISSISQFDTSTIYKQVQSDLAEFKEEEQADFIAWFNQIKSQLTEDAAGNLQEQLAVVKNNLGGFTFYNSPDDLGMETVSYHIPDIVKAMPISSIYVAYVQASTTYALTEAKNNFPVNNGMLEIIKPDTHVGRTRVLYFAKTNAVITGLYYCDLDENNWVINGWHRFVTDAELEELEKTVGEKALKSHADETGANGRGTSQVYGHCKTINNLTTAEHEAGFALSAYQGKVLNDAKAPKESPVLNLPTLTWGIIDGNTQVALRRGGSAGEYALVLVATNSDGTTSFHNLFDGKGTFLPTVLKLTGGTLTGTLSTTHIRPTTGWTYSLGTASAPYDYAYSRRFSAYHTDGKRYGSLFANTLGTASTNGQMKLELGNNTASGTDGNAYGSITMYGTNTGYTLINPSNNTPSNITLTLPSASGRIPVMSRSGTTLTIKGLA